MKCGTRSLDQAPPVCSIGRLSWRDGLFAPGCRDVPEEMPIALSYNRTAHAVMMATPLDLVDFALGFSLAEQIVASAAEIEEIETVLLPAAGDAGPAAPPRGTESHAAPPRGSESHAAPPRGIELRIWIGEHRMRVLDQRRRHVAGPTGCGLCGLESLEAALRPLPRLATSRRYRPAAIEAAVASLRPAQTLNQATRAVHAAGFWTEAAGLVALREDVGRHNALDKLHGALALDAAVDPADGILVMTSRISVELVQKAAIMGVPVLAAVSAPTALALRVAEQAGITLIAVARPDGFELCTGLERIIGAG